MFDHFNFLAPIYDKVIQPKTPERLIQLLDSNPGLNLLDVGGGTGRISQFLTDSNKQVIIADTSFKMLQKSQEKRGLVQINAASESLPFGEDLFDRILMVDALHHVIDQTQTAAELWRVLKPGGKIVIEEPDIKKVAVKLIAAAEKITLMRSRFLAAEQIGELFTDHSAEIKLIWEDHFTWVIVKKPV